MNVAPFVRTTLAAACLGAAAVLHAATVNVDTTQRVRVVDDRVFGINAVLWDGKTSDPQTISLVKAADFRMIRIPGGSLSDEYHWTKNVTGTNTWTWAASMKDFAALITNAGTQATVVVNYGTGTPEEAAAWVAYANADPTVEGKAGDVALGTDSKGQDWHSVSYWAKLRAATPLATDDGLNFLRLGRAQPLGLKYWEIGNEVYGASWETDQNTVPHDPYTYAVRSKDYIAKMKAVDPSIRIGVVAEVGEDTYANNNTHPTKNPRTGVTHNGWTPVMLATLKSLGVVPDALVYHRYEQTPDQETDAALLQKARTWPDDAKDLRQQLNDYLSTDAGRVELVVTENNSVYTNPGKQSTSLVNGLFYADAIGNVLQTEINEYLWWALRNGTPTGSSDSVLVGNISSSLYGWRQYGDYGVLSMPNKFGQTSNFEGYPSYYTMKLVSHFARGGDTVVKASSDSTLLSAFAAKRLDGSVTLLVVNKDPTNDTAATISLAGFAPKTTATVYSYGVPQDEAAHNGGGTNDVATSSIATAGTSFTYTFPHYSATVIALAQSAPTIVIGPAATTVGAGAKVAFSVLATGTGTLTYQWQKNDVAIAGATASALTLASVSAADAANYRVLVTDAAGATTTSDEAGLSVSGTFTAPTSELVNISTRGAVGTGAKVMIAGFVIGPSGSGAKRVLIRGLGPALLPFGLPMIANPQIELTKLDGTIIATNDDWGQGDAAAIAAAGHDAGAYPMPDGSKDAAMIVTLPSGGYTAILKGPNVMTGLGLIEVYDLDTGAAARLLNLSTRGQVGEGSQALIGGFAVQGSSNRKLLVRAVGPYLSQYFSDALADPLLKLTDPHTGAVIVQNDNWSDNAADVMAATSATSAFPLPDGSKDAALIANVPAGTYTPTVVGGSGIALVEVYEAP